MLGVESFPTDERGYRRLIEWLRALGPVMLVGVEGTGSYGAGLTRSLQQAGLKVVEVDRPNRQARHRAGKSDPLDAIAAARAALSGTASGAPKSRTGNVEAIRVLMVARRSAVEERITTLNQLRHLCITAPEPIRRRFASDPKPPGRTCAASHHCPTRCATRRCWQSAPRRRRGSLRFVLAAQLPRQVRPPLDGRGRRHRRAPLHRTRARLPARWSLPGLIVSACHGAGQRLGAWTRGRRRCCAAGP